MQERKKEALTNNIEPLLVTCKFQATARGQPLFVDVASLSADSPEPDLTPEEELELVKKMIGDMKDIENADRLLKEVEVNADASPISPNNDQDLFNIPGGGKVAKKLLDQLDPYDRWIIEQLMKEVADNPARMPAVAFKVMQLIINELSWNAIKNSFSDFGWWESIQIALSLVAILAAGPVAAVINVALNAVAIAKLVAAILACPELVG
eukprot:CAMPEP_0172377220 /NCGR_PEP_ID=MMETSP1060-20121228/68788_1 /TAXON_ID=37318 /ORGANISM="Pseudo-nitzschia pungens, Strain cf. cingulata" /LENGTH=208 /DNA_ID=CAMNT_0013104893 /DNA_START=1231 /DNA_END=1856 /DNA_ORIENTATION=-